MAQVAPPKKSQGTVLKIDSFYMPQLERARDIWVYLPADYSTTNKRYPVLYMQDGQNLFEDSASFVGEWHLDETMDSLQKRGDYGCIVIGIENGGSLRTEEYLPYFHSDYASGKGDMYVDFIVETLKPFVDKTYRTKREATFTGIGGSSLGAYISYYAALKHPDVFQKTLVFSPAFWVDESVHQNIDSNNLAQKTVKWYLLAGEKEGTDAEVVAAVNRCIIDFIKAGFDQNNFKISITSDGEHREWCWSREFGPACVWLFKNENGE